MNSILPKDKASGVISREARQLVHNSFSAERWDYHEETGADNGRDCIIELIEDERFGNKKIECQIKGTLSPKQLKKEGCFTFPLDVKTINYGLSSPIAFVLLYVTVDDKKVYYLPIQDYFIANPKLFDRLSENKTTLNVHIPCDNIVREDDYELQQIAKSVYVGGPTKKLRKVE